MEIFEKLFDYDNKTQVDVQMSKQEKVNKEIEDLLHRIRTEKCLWDMRTWERFHDREEVMNWLKNMVKKTNCGHTEWCIRRLKEYKVENFIICNAIMDNEYISFKDIKVFNCWNKKYDGYGNYIECTNNCSNCMVTNE